MAALSPAAATRPEASARFLTRPTTCSCAGTPNEGPARVRTQDGALRVPRGRCHDRLPFRIRRPDAPERVARRTRSVISIAQLCQGRSPVLKNVGFREVVFSVNCFIAAMLALFIAFRLNFSNPWWAMLTVYLTSQPLSGALRAKAVYRLLGTLLSGVAMLVIVPNLADAPELTTAAIILWVALCVYASVLDRTP